MRRREFLTGAAALAGMTSQAEAFGFGKLGADFGTLGDLGGAKVALPVVQQSGGTVTTAGGRTIITFTGNGAISSNMPFTANVLVVGGGGGGASGGGGGGAVVVGSNISLPAGSILATVGAGGLGVAVNGAVDGASGVASSFYNLTAPGGAGGGQINHTPAPSGGSGGGVGATSSIAETGGTGNPGGNGGSNASFFATPHASAGGGGAGGAGANVASNSVGTAGGVGINSSISGSSTYYGGGGGGTVFSTTGGSGAGGLGGGGAGASAGLNGSSGTANTGGGGGGASEGAGVGVGGNGGSGIVIISFVGSIQTATPRLGQVATRVYLPNSKTASTTGWNSVTAHYARDNISALSIADVNWYVTAAVGETNQGGTSTITRSVEYPLGTFTQVQWSGSTSTTLADGATVFSDSCTVSIPRGALFRLHKYQVNSSGVLLCTQAPMNTALGEGINNSNVDQTMGGFVASGATTLIPTPTILAQTTVKSICAIGSSRMLGVADAADSSGDSGYARMFGRWMAYQNFGIGSDTLSAVIASGSKRMALAAYCTHLWIDPGLNDINGGNKPASTVLGYISTIASGWPSLANVIVNNEATWTASTDGWTTTVNQSVESFEAQRVLLNTGIAALTGYNQTVDPNSSDGNGTNSQFWNNPAAGGFQYTTDGIHELQAALLKMVNANLFNAALVIP